VLTRIGSVAYKLQLPESSHVHPVFHVSQLKQAVGKGHEVISSLPVIDTPFQVPVRVVKRRIIRRGDAMVAHVKVSWSGMDPKLSTWEDTEALQQRFPAAPAWGQAAPQAVGDVGTPAIDDKEEDGGLRRSVRERQPNVKLSGPEWAKSPG